MKITLLLTSTILAVLPLAAMAQDYQGLKPFILQPFVFNAQNSQQNLLGLSTPTGVPLNLTRDLNIDVNPQPVEVTPVEVTPIDPQPVKPLPVIKPAPIVTPLPVAIPIIQPIITPLPTQNISGGLFQDPDSFGGGNVPAPAPTIKPTPAPQAPTPTAPVRIPWPQPGFTCCWPQNIGGSLHVDPDKIN